MKTEYDEEKRLRTLAERGLDFEDASRVLGGHSVTKADDRRDYGENRSISIGPLDGGLVVICGPAAKMPTASFP